VLWLHYVQRGASGFHHDLAQVPTTLIDQRRESPEEQQCGFHPGLPPVTQSSLVKGGRQVGATVSV